MITNVLHHFSEKRATEPLRRAAEVLRPDGRLALVGFTADNETPAADPMPYLFSILMLVWTNEGEVHPRPATTACSPKPASADRTSTVADLPLRVLIAQPASAISASTVDSVFRVMLRMQIHPGMEGEFEQAWPAAARGSRRRAGEPSNGGYCAARRSAACTTSSAIGSTRTGSALSRTAPAT